MRIGIDYTAAVNQVAGIGRYTRELVRALLDLDMCHEYVLLVPAGPKRVEPAASRSESGAWSSRVVSHSSADVEGCSRIRLVHLPLPERFLTILWHRLRLPLVVELFAGALDVFHSPDFSLPPTYRARPVLTVHDLSFMRLPQCSYPSLRAFLTQVVPRSVRRAEVVLADSECTRNDVIQLLGADPRRVRVIYPGVDERFRRVSDQDTLDAVRLRYGLPDHFVLSVGTLQPRKNYERLVEAYALVRAHSDIKLVIAGGKGWMYDGIFRKVEELGLRNDVRFLGYVDDKDLPALYTLAALFAFPSLYEGFGLPALEAMACGTPVVASNASSLPEVVGAAALLVNPTDVSALAEAILEMLDDHARRDDIVQRGLAQAQRFTWNQAALHLLAIYQEMAEPQGNTGSAHGLGNSRALH